VAILACVPYLTLKVAWLSGSTAGIPQGSALREDDATLWGINALTLMMDAAVVVIAFALTRPWGRRLPSWLMLTPLWLAMGLISPIVGAVPVQAVYGMVSGGAQAGSGGGGDDGGSSGMQGAGQNDLLEGWVWGTVYSGFIIQGIALTWLFLLYARDRWGYLLRSSLDLRAPAAGGGSGRAPSGFIVALVALWPAVMHILWAAGSDMGLSDSRIDSRNADTHIVEGAHALLGCLAVVGLLMLLRSRRGRPGLAMAWIGSGAMAGWGGWMLLVTSTAGGSAETATTPLMVVTYALQMMVGLLIAGLVARAVARVTPSGPAAGPGAGMPGAALAGGAGTRAGAGAGYAQV
jgi:hypothetical protein